MKATVSLILSFLVLGGSTLAYSQSLAELARKEKERREKMKGEAKVIAFYDLSRYRGGSVTTGSIPPPAIPETSTGGQSAANKPATTPAGQKPEDPNEPVDHKGRTESYWRQTMQDAQQKVKELENEANVLTLKIADLQTRFLRESDGYNQQTINRDLQKAFYEQDLNKQNLEKARAMLAELETEARKSGALPGWLRPKP